MSARKKMISAARDIIVPIRIDMGRVTSIQSEIQLPVSKKVLE